MAEFMANEEKHLFTVLFASFLIGLAGKSLAKAAEMGDIAFVRAFSRWGNRT